MNFCRFHMSVCLKTYLAVAIDLLQPGFSHSGDVASPHKDTLWEKTKDFTKGSNMQSLRGHLAFCTCATTKMEVLHMTYIIPFLQSFKVVGVW